MNFSILLVLIMLYRPQGLLGAWELLPPEAQNGSRKVVMGILDVKNCTKRFGGLVAVRNLNMSLTPGEPLWADRPERRRQDDCLQPHHRRVHAR